MVCHGSPRRVYCPSSVVGIEAVHSGYLFCRWRGEEALSRVGRWNRRLRIGNYLYTHPAGAVINKQSFRLFTVERVNDLTVRSQCFHAYKTPRSHQLIGHSITEQFLLLGSVGGEITLTKSKRHLKDDKQQTESQCVLLDGQLKVSQASPIPITPGLPQDLPMI